MEIKLVKSAFKFGIGQSAFDQYLKELNNGGEGNLVFAIGKDAQENFGITDDHLIGNINGLNKIIYFIRVGKIINPDLKFLSKNFSKMLKEFKEKHKIELIIVFGLIEIGVFKINEKGKLENDYLLYIEQTGNDDYVFYTKANGKETTEKIYF